MNGDDLFSGELENVMRWLSTAGIVFALISAGLIAFFLTRRPGWRMTPPAKWLLLVGFFLLPSTTMLLGNVVGFHRVKTSCAECHVMDPWISDLRDPKSTTLAAKHYQNRWINENPCYTCHTGYGLAGNLEAKWSGLRHVWHYYVAGVPEEIKMKRPLPVKTCLHCHAQAASYLKIEQHVDPEMEPQILSGELSCFECHASPHPRKNR
ncbi:MAG: NapC/NirT family cytochrome c [Planctomycetes bacterium]|nr:NapC/NirT family cytochrome c [Planctomycetota bacterium]